MRGMRYIVLAISASASPKVSRGNLSCCPEVSFDNCGRRHLHVCDVVEVVRLRVQGEIRGHVDLNREKVIDCCCVFSLVVLEKREPLVRGCLPTRHLDGSQDRRLSRRVLPLLGA